MLYIPMEEFAVFSGNMKKVFLGTATKSYGTPSPLECTEARYRSGVKGYKKNVQGEEIDLGGGINITTDGCPPGFYGYLMDCKPGKNQCPYGTAACLNGWFGPTCQNMPCGADDYKGGKNEDKSRWKKKSWH